MFRFHNVMFCPCSMGDVLVPHSTKYFWHYLLEMQLNDASVSDAKYWERVMRIKQFSTCAHGYTRAVQRKMGKIHKQPTYNKTVFLTVFQHSSIEIKCNTFSPKIFKWFAMYHPRKTLITVSSTRLRSPSNIYFTAGAVAKYCDEFVCVCLSVREDISGTTRVILSTFCACCLCPWLGPPVACWR